jgi:protein O-mannosyl-transferase
MSRKNKLRKLAAAVPKRASVPAAFSSGRSKLRESAIPFGICAGLALMIVLVYSQTRQFEFVELDDPAYVFQNPHIMSGLTGDNLKWVFTSIHAGYWHPLTSISHMFDAELYGNWAGGHHLTNMLIHCATSMLLFAALRRLTGELWPCAFAAAVFALHPLRVESVAWVAERKDVLSGFFFTLTLLAYARYAQRPSFLRYLLVALPLILGLMSKPMLVTVPFVLLLLDYWPLHRLRQGAGPKTVARLLAEKAPLLALAVAFSVLTVFTQDRAVKALSDISMMARVTNAAVSYVAYCRQMLWPSELTVFYPHPKDSLPDWQVIGAFGLLIWITAMAIRARRTRPYLLVGWLWYLGMMFPVIGLMQSGFQARADRFTYLPQIGLAIALAWWAADLAVLWQLRPRNLAIAAAGVIAILAACSWLQAGYWCNTMSLFNRALDHTTQNYFIQYHLGIALGREARLTGREELFNEAIEHLRKAEAINPNDYGTQFNYGLLLCGVNRNEEGIVHLRRSVELSPTSFEAVNELSVALYGLATTLNPAEKQRRLDEAATACESARNLNPRFANVYVNFGSVRADQGRFEEAIALLQQAIALDSNFAQAYVSLGRTYYRMGKLSETIGAFREALRLQPDDLYSLKAAALVASTSSDPNARCGADAVVWAKHAVELSKGQDPQIVDALAAAYAEVERFDEAVANGERALELAVTQKHEQDEQIIRGHLKSFYARTPIREDRSK